MREFWFSLINANEKVPPIYWLAGAVFAVFTLVYGIFTATAVQPMRTIMILAYVGLIVVMVSGISFWMVLKWITWQYKVVQPNEEFLEKVTDVAVIGRIPRA